MTAMADTAVQTVSGPLTFQTVPDVYAASAGWFGGTDGVTIDLKAVTLADSAGLALLIEWVRQAGLTGKTVSLINMPEQVQHLIRVNGLGAALLGSANSG